MAEPGDIEQPFPSTNFEWRKVKIKTPPARQTTARAKRGRWYGLPTWPRHRSIRLEVVSRGGAESWWLVCARGRNGVFPGWMGIEDVMAAVLNEYNGPLIETSAEIRARQTERRIRSSFDMGKDA